MSTKTRTRANLRLPQQAEPPSSRTVVAGPAAPDNTRERRRSAVALVFVLVALGAVAAFLIFMVAGADTETPSAPSDNGITGELPDVSGSDRHLYERVPQASQPLPGINDFDVPLYQRASK